MSKRYSYHPGVLDSTECEGFHEVLAVQNYEDFVGWSPKEYDFDPRVRPAPEEIRLALGDLAHKITERLPGMVSLKPEIWRARVNQWSSARIIGETGLRPHRDNLRVDVATVSLQGEGTFKTGRDEFKTRPGDVVVLHNRRFLSPKHSVLVDSETRMSVAIWEGRY